MTIDNAIDVYLRADTGPLYPDSPSGQVYFQDTFLDTDSWLGTGLVVSVNSGSLVLTSVSTGIEYIRRTVNIAAAAMFKVRVRKTAGTITSVGLVDNLGDTTLTFVPTATWQVMDLVPVLNWTGTLTYIQLSLNGQSADCILEFDWIYVGTGARLEWLMDYLGGGGAPTLTTGRIYWLQAPENALVPYVVMTVVSDTDRQEFFGTPNAGQGRLQTDVVSTVKSDKAIALRIRYLLRHAHGVLGGLTVNAIMPINRREFFVINTSRFVFSADYEVHCEY